MYVLLRRVISLKVICEKVTLIFQMVIFAIVFMTMNAHTYNLLKTCLMMFKPRAKTLKI